MLPKLKTWFRKRSERRCMDFRHSTLGTDFRAWIFRILRNTFLTSRTGLRAKLTVELDPEDEETIPVTWETPESLALASATREALQSRAR